MSIYIAKNRIVKNRYLNHLSNHLPDQLTNQLTNQLEINEKNYHLICYVLSRKPTAQMIQVDKPKQIAHVRSGRIFIKPASCSGSRIWRNMEDSLTLLIHPNFLHQLAVKNRFSKFSKVELLPTEVLKDPLFEQICSLFYQEVKHSQPGGKLYSNSLSTVLALHLLRHYCIFSGQAETPKIHVPESDSEAEKVTHRLFKYVSSKLNFPIDIVK